MPDVLFTLAGAQIRLPEAALAAAAFGLLLRGIGAQARDHGRRIRSLQEDLHHMADVEQAAGGTRVPVLGQYAGRIEQRHVIAGKRAELGAEFTVEGV